MPLRALLTCMILAGFANRMDFHDVTAIGSSRLCPHEATATTLSLSNTVPHAIGETLHAARERGITDDGSRHGHTSISRWVGWHYTRIGTTGLED